MTGSASARPLGVLFLCTHNAARSIIAESVLTRVSNGRFAAYSAGSRPSGEVNPHVLALLKRLNYPTGELRSKSWTEFAQPDSPPLDFVFTVCDETAKEECPVWPGAPVAAHWGFPDPATFTGNDTEIALMIADLYRQIERRITLFAALPFSSLDKLALTQRLRDMA